jgi:competence protein ComFC
MRCLVCENFSLTQHICKGCQKQFLTPSLYKRVLPNGITVLSFYKYHDIKTFLTTKHTNIGFHIYRLLAKLSFLEFAKTFQWDTTVASLCIDDKIKNGYAHTAILNKALQTPSITPYYNKLLAQNNISYSKKSKAYRLAHPRNFHFNNVAQREIILVDDIITTGTTLYEASSLLLQHQKEILFCLTLADVNLK